MFNTRKHTILTSFFYLLITCVLAVSQAYADDVYSFNRFWPQPGQSSSFTQPYSIAIDSEGLVYIADSFKNEILVYYSDGRLIQKWATRDRENNQAHRDNYPPHGIAVKKVGDSTLVYVTYTFDNSQYAIGVYDENGSIQNRWYMDKSEINSLKEERTFPHGIAVNSNGRMYVTDSESYKIRVYETKTGFSHVFQEGLPKKEKILKPTSIVIGLNNEIYVVDSLNQRVVVFDENENYMYTLANSIAEDNQFKNPVSLAIDHKGQIYVSDRLDGIQVFDNKGNRLDFWLDGQSGEKALAINSKKKQIYIANGAKGQLKIFGIKGDNKGKLIYDWKNIGAEKGQFNSPAALAVDANDLIYVWDQSNQRIQIFDELGQFKASWGKNEFESEGEILPDGIIFAADMAVDSDNIYLVDNFKHRVLVFNVINGAFRRSWGGRFGAAPGLFKHPRGITVSNIGNERKVYVADTGNQRIQIFDIQGNYLRTVGEGTLNMPTDVAIDLKGLIYIIDHIKQELQIFGSNGDFKESWVNDNNQQKKKKLHYPDKITIDSRGRVFVTDIIDNDNLIGDGSQRIQVFNAFGDVIQSISSSGSDVNQFMNVTGIGVSTNDNLFISDNRNNRIQKFISNSVTESKTKAIILAGGGPSKGDFINNIWKETQFLTGYAINALKNRGVTDIKYLIADNNGKVVNAETATLETLEKAITEWATKDTDNVVIYMADHGGPNELQINSTEFLKYKDLNAWVDKLNANIPGTVTIIIEACYSGSFLQSLAGESRYLISSSDKNQYAMMENQGQSSFSYYFWSLISAGYDVEQAYRRALNSTKSHIYQCETQSSQLDSNGDKVFNTNDDFSLLKALKLGVGRSFASSPPVIDQSSLLPKTKTVLDGETKATLSMTVLGTGKIKAWAVISPPNSSQCISTDELIREPISTLPEIDLICEKDETTAGRSHCFASYDQFMFSGKYQVTYYAKNVLNTRQDLLATPRIIEIFQKADLSKITTPLYVNKLPVTANFESGNKYDWFVFYGESGGHPYDLSISIDPDFTSGIINPLISILNEGGDVLLKETKIGDLGKGGKQNIKSIIKESGFYIIQVYNPSIHIGDYHIQVKTNFAEEPKKVIGVLIDQCTKSRITGADIVVGTQFITSDHLGNFSFQSNSGMYRLPVYKESYNEKEAAVQVKEKKENMIYIEMEPISLVTSECSNAAVYDGKTGILKIDVVKYNDKYYTLQLQKMSDSDQYWPVPNSASLIEDISTISLNNISAIYDHSNRLLTIPHIHRSKKNCQGVINHKAILKRIDNNADYNNWIFDLDRLERTDDQDFTCPI